MKMNETFSYSTVSRGDCVVLTTNTFIHKSRKFLFHLRKNKLFYFRDCYWINNNKFCSTYR
jgi:hypothetical protein